MTAGLLGDPVKLSATLNLLAEDPNIDAMIVAFDFAELDLDLGYDMNTFLEIPCWNVRQSIRMCRSLSCRSMSRSAIWIGA